MNRGSVLRNKHFKNMSEVCNVPHVAVFCTALQYVNKSKGLFVFVGGSED